MNWRNARFNALGTIDMEIEHERYGWLPFTANPDDPEQRGRDLYAEAMESGEVAAYAPPTASPEQLQAEILAATQVRLDEFARTRFYDGILSAATYATSTVPKFASEGQYAVELRDATWETLYTLLAEVRSGARPLPAGYADIEPLLPVPAWPEA